MSDNIQVAIRLRPLNEREIKSGKSLAWKTPDQKTIFYIDNKATDQKYVFDRVYDCEESTYDIYEETVKDIVLAGIDGFNGTIFAYGQTSSGKTYTMSGTKNQMGIIPLAIQSIFTKINNSPDREFLLRVSYMEIYNEKITDLLDPEEKTLKMLEDENRQIVVSGLHEEVFRCGADVINLKKKGDARRRVAETARNEESSRSHAIFQIIIESQERQFNEDDLVDESVRLSSLYFVDLAGSEKASENSGERFREGCAINKSLMTLGQVISKLSDGISNQHINYRDSKLTRLLQNGLGGNSKTVIICTINPTIMDETNSTLRFASRAKIIKNKPTINELTDTSDKAILKRYQKEIANLQQQLEAFKNQTPQKNFNPFYNNIHEQEKAELETKYQSVISKLKSMICVSTTSPSKKKIVRRETWCPGVLKRKLEQAGHLPAIGVIGTPSHVLGNILEETPVSESSENVIQPKGPVIYVNSACQTVKTVENDVILLKLENEMLQNQITMVSTELTDLKARPAKQRRVSFENHDETKEFLELELKFAQEKNNHVIEEEKKLEMERRKLKEERIIHDEAIRAFQAEKKHLMQRVEATESENSCLLKSLEHSQERVKNLEYELNYLQNQSSMTTGVKRCSMDRPLLNLSNITDRTKRSSRGDCEALKEQVFSLQSEVQMQETEIQKLTRDLDKCKEQLKNKFDEIRFLSLETTEQKEKIEILQQENKNLSQRVDDKTPVSELPEVKELNARLSEISQEKHSLQQKLKSKSEEITYLSRQSAIYCEQIESKNVCSSEMNRKASEEVEALKAKLAAMDAEKSQTSEMETQLKSLIEEYGTLKEKLQAEEEKVKSLTSELESQNKSLEYKEEICKFLYESNTSIKTEMDQLKDQIVSQNKTINNSSLQITGNIFIIDY
ncbi:CENPE [Acanthosepion pharaonis]|uniref:Kinesin-like protein n=1 Tax=Acanthosepion pharaonis TaxID=158019 RepID=A0A812DU32_ACAPH|nr:CENPE [Sepia pharaonis]